jgi:hypothetical protein
MEDVKQSKNTQSNPNDKSQKVEPEVRVLKIRTNLRAGSKEGSVAPKE